MATVVNFIDTTLQSAPSRSFNLPNAAVLLSASTNGFHVNSAGANDPASITFTASLIALEGAIIFAATGGTITTAGNVATLTYANMPGSTASVTASVTVNGQTFTSNVCAVTKVLDGANGAPSYTWIKYATSSAGAGLTDDPAGMSYIGLAYNKATATESTVASDYAWSLIKGADGAPGNQGVPGANGADGLPTYTWIKYADVADGTGLYDTPTAATLYIGLAVNKTSATESIVKTDYVWSKFKGDQGVPGTNNAIAYAYQRPATAPTGSPGAVTYDFATNTITTATLANGWQKTIPAANGNPLYVTAASASAAGTTDTIASGEWSGAVVLAQDGANGAAGLNSATITIYQRSATATAPALPSASTNYTFATGVLTGLNNGWSQYIPSSGGAYLHTSLATAAATTATDAIAASEWAAVTLMYDAAALIAAQAAADAANTAVSIIAADNWLSKGEKPHEILKWNTIVGEFSGIQVQADNLLVGHTAYDNAYVALLSYLNSINTAPAWTDLSVDTPISGTDYRTNFLNYYNAKMSLLNAIAAKAAFAPSLVIGGRNLYSRTTFISTTGDGSTLVAQNTSGFTLNGIFSNAGIIRMYGLITKVGPYTISFDLRLISGGTYPLTIDVCDGYGGAAQTIVPSSTKQHFKMTFNVAYVDGTYNFIDFNGLSDQDYEFTNFKVEEGNKETTYTPAPEDVAADTALAQTAADTANAAINHATTGLAQRLRANAVNVLSGGGAVTIGSLTVDSAGNRTGGNGVGITGKGLAAYAPSGAATISLDATTGDAGFGGTLTAANMVGTSHMVNDSVSGADVFSSIPGDGSAQFVVSTDGKVLVLASIANNPSAGAQGYNIDKFVSGTTWTLGVASYSVVNANSSNLFILTAGTYRFSPLGGSGYVTNVTVLKIKK